MSKTILKTKTDVEDFIDQRTMSGIELYVKSMDCSRIHLQNHCTNEKGAIEMFFIAVCDDKEILCSQIERVLDTYFKKDCLETTVFYSGEKLYEALSRGEHYDLIFLDIELNTMNGVDVGKKIRDELKNDRVHIIYISAKQKYAMELFKIRPLNFLVKPITKDEILSNVEEAMRLSAYYDDCFEYKKAKASCREAYGNIMYFESCGRKVIFHTKDAKQEAYIKLNAIADRAPRTFLRIHQSYLINSIYVKRWEYDTVYLTNGITFSISQSYRRSVREWIFAQGNDSGGV